MAESPEKILSECMALFAREDFIMEPDIIAQLKRFVADLLLPCSSRLLLRFFSAEGSPEVVIDLLCNNYHAVAQTANLLAEMLCSSGEAAVPAVASRLTSSQA